MENNNVQPIADVVNISGKGENNKGKSLVLGVVIGIFVGVLIMWGAYPYLFKAQDSSRSDGEYTQSGLELFEENQVESPTPEVSEIIEKEEEWYDFEGKHIKGQYTDNWKIEEVIGVSLDSLPNGIEEDYAANLLGKLKIIYDDKALVELTHIEGGVGYSLECSETIPVFADTDKSFYERARKDWALNGINPKYVEIEEKYEELQFFNISMRRRKDIFFYDVYTTGNTFEPDCSGGMNGRIPPFVEVGGKTMGLKMDVEFIKNNNKLLLQLDKTLNSLEKVE